MKNSLSTFGSSLFDDFFNSRSFNKSLMKTDIKEDDNCYALSMELPGVKKEDIQVSLNQGYLTVKAIKNEKHDEEKENYVSKECFYGETSRSFYVGEGVAYEDIEAKLDEGVLKLNIKKKELPEKEENKFIEIK